MNSVSPNKPSSGFTLLEVLIAMAILVFIAFAIYQATMQTYKLRDTLSTEGNFYNSIRLSMTIFQRDLSLLYSPHISLPPKSPTASPPPNGQPNAVSDDLAISSTYWSAALDNTGLRPSRFVGSDSKMTFIALSHIRIYKDSPESEFAKISYETRKDDKNTDISGAMVLVKTETPNAFAPDDFRDSLSRSYHLLRGIKSIKFTYLMRDGNTWKTLTSWDSDREETKNKYPDMIQIKMEVVGPKKQIFDGFYKFRPEIPVNGLNPSS